MEQRTNLKFVGLIAWAFKSPRRYQRIMAFRTLGTTSKMLVEKCRLYRLRGLSKRH